jgi:ABC-type branched-subunit amino acid transport system substrate-binding protein
VLSRKFILAAATLVVALFAAACGSSSSSSSSSASSGSSGSTQSSSGSSTGGSTIQLMQIIAPGNFGFGDLSLGTKAAVDAINASGGVDGHKLALAVCSAGSPPFGDPDSVSQCGTKAVSDKVVAFVGDFIAFDSPLFAASQSVGIPTVQPAALSSVDLTSDRSFPTGGGATTINAGLGEMLDKDGCHDVMDLDIAGEANFDAYEGAIRAGVLEDGGKFGGALTYTQNQADFAPVVQSAISKGADCLAVPDGLNFVALLQAVKASGNKLKVGVNQPDLTPAEIKQLGANGEGLIGSDVQKLSSKTISKIEADFAKYEPQAGPSGLEEGNWESVELVAEAASSVLKAGKPLTSANLTAGLDNIPNFGDGVAASFNFNKAGPVPKQPRLTDGTVFGDVLENGAWKPWKPLPTVNAFPALLKYDN